MSCFYIFLHNILSFTKNTVSGVKLSGDRERHIHKLNIQLAKTRFIDN